jgi:tRNA uridine 5-carboxymethylaminomethyl modification enzyme
MKTLFSEVQNKYFYPNVETKERIAHLGISDIHDRVSAETFLKRPEVDFEKLAALGFETTITDLEVFEQIEIQTKYRGYIEKDLHLLEGVRNADQMKIPIDLDYREIAGLSNEIRGRLSDVRPESIGQASRLQGVTPAAVANLMIFIKNAKQNRAAKTL